MSYFIHRLSTGLTFKPDKKTTHPGLNLFIVVIEFIFLIFPTSDLKNIELLTLLLAFLTLEIIVSKNIHNCLNLLRGILPLLIITGLVTLFFAGPLRSVLLILRLSTGALMFSLFIIHTNPSDFSKLLEQLRLPVIFAIIPSLSLSLIPRTLKDIEDTYNTLYLRGEIKGTFIRWLPTLLGISISSTIYRSNFIEESLVIRGFNSHHREKNGPNHSLTRYDFLKIIFWISAFSIILYVLQAPSLL